MENNSYYIDKVKCGNSHRDEDYWNIKEDKEFNEQCNNFYEDITINVNSYILQDYRELATKYGMNFTDLVKFIFEGISLPDLLENILDGN